MGTNQKISVTFSEAMNPASSSPQYIQRDRAWPDSRYGKRHLRCDQRYRDVCAQPEELRNRHNVYRHYLDWRPEHGTFAAGE